MTLHLGQIADLGNGGLCCLVPRTREDIPMDTKLVRIYEHETKQTKSTRNFGQKTTSINCRSTWVFDSKIQGHTLPVFIPRFFAERNMNIYGGRYNNEDVSLTICLSLIHI